MRPPRSKQENDEHEASLSTCRPNTTPTDEAMATCEEDLDKSTEEAALSRGLDDEVPSPGEDALAPQDATLATSLGPGPATHRSARHGVELEVVDGSLDVEVVRPVTISPRLKFVECRSEGSGR